MITDISLIGTTTVAVTFDSGRIKEFDLPINPSPEWDFDEDDRLILTIKHVTYQPVALGDLTINGDAVADVAAAKTALRAVFPDAGGATGETNLEAVTTDIIITDSSKGLILKSPNGNQHRISINNDGSISTTQL